MKYITLFLHKLRLHFVSNPLLLSIFCLGGFVCTLSSVILYGNTMPHMTSQTPEKYYRSFDVHLDEPIPAQNFDTVNLIHTVLGNYAIEDIVLNAKLEFQKTSYDKDGINIQASLRDRIFEEDSSSAAFIPESPSQAKQIILSKLSVSHKKTETFELLGENYMVVGYADHNYITYQDFTSLNLPVHDVRIVLKSEPNANQRDDLTQILLSRFPKSQIQNAKYYLAQDRSLATEAMGILIVLYLLLFLSHAFILYDILQSELYVLIVFRLHGATALQILRLLIGEILFLLTASGGLACLIHKCLYDVVFQNFNLYENITYHICDYAVIILLTDLVALLCMIPFLRKIMSKYSYQMKKEAGGN